MILRSRTHIPSQMESGKQEKLIITIANFGAKDHCYIKMYIQGEDVWGWDGELDEGAWIQFEIYLTITVKESASFELKLETGHFVDETGVTIDDMLSQWIYVEKPSVSWTTVLALATLVVGAGAIGAAVYKGR